MTIRAERDFAIVDVFTRDAGGGNPLAVFFDGRGISDTAMQRLAREFNFSETTFVLPSNRDDCDFRVRIFTPTREVPFAGHPNIGTACALAARGMLEHSQVRFEELAGRVVLTVDREQADHARLRAPESFSEGESYPISLVSSVLGLAEDEIDTSVHDPCEASTGLPFSCVALKSEASLRRAKVDLHALDIAVAAGVNPDLHCYVRDGQKIEARMFAPLDGVPEDPATGSANCALVGLLASRDPSVPDAADWHVSQGVQMGRPSQLELHTVKQEGAVLEIYLAGACRAFATGRARID